MSPDRRNLNRNLSRRQCLQLLGITAAATILPRPPLTWAETVSTSADEVGLFLGLSSVLTGLPRAELDVDLALEYMDRLESRAPGVLPILLAEFAAILHETRGDREGLVQLVEERIWKPGCPKISVGGSEICYQTEDPECCLARDIPLLWYTSALMVTTDLVVPSTQFEYGSAEAYIGALAWRVGEGHPQAQCGGTYGYWSTLPGEPHKTSG